MRSSGELSWPWNNCLWTSTLLQESSASITALLDFSVSAEHRLWLGQRRGPFHRLMAFKLTECTIRPKQISASAAHHWRKGKLWRKMLFFEQCELQL
jgi:hypothetical protein